MDFLFYKIVDFLFPKIVGASAFSKSLIRVIRSYGARSIVWKKQSNLQISESGCLKILMEGARGLREVKH